MSESLIESYIAFPETLDAPTRTAIEARLHDDPAARKIAEFYTSFYALLRSTEAEEGGRLDNPTADGQPEN